MNKDVLRKKLITKRNSIKERNIKDLEIYSKIIELIDKDILIYYSKKNEVNTIPIMEFAFHFGYRVYIPKCINNTMEFYEITNINDVEKGSYNIMEPISTIKPNDINNTICIIPGLGFDNSFNRIGYGGGYYDKFLSNYKGIKIGICYDELLIDNIPTEKTDIKMDIIVTNKKVLKKELY